MSLPVARRHAALRRTLIRELFESAPPDTLNLGLGQPDLVTPEPIRRAGVRAIEEGWTGYSPTAGYPGLREAVAERYPGFCSGPEGVVVTVGAEEAVCLALFTLLDPGDEVLVPDPGFPSYPVVTRLAGGVPVPYPLRAERGFELDPADIEKRLGERTRLVILCNPSNPAGAVEEEATLRELARLAERRDFYWLADEIYEAFDYESRHVSLARLSDRGLVVSGVSKSLSMTGWRIGWLASADPAFAAKATALHQYLVTCSCSISQRAAEAALGEEGRACQRELVERFRRRRDLLRASLEQKAGLSLSPPRGAFYLFADVRRWGNSLALARRLIDEARVMTVPGEAFGAQAAGWLRLSYAASEEVLEEAAERIARVLRAQNPGQRSSGSGGR
jgi:aspartate aminotransferase